MIDSSKQVDAVVRSVDDREVEGKLAKAVIISQTYDTDIHDLWDAVTNQERIPRWFVPVSGDLQLNGRFHVENNASGTITACEPPTSFDATWEFGDGISWIEVRLEAVDDEHARLELIHLAHPDEHWEQFGAGAAGVGWDFSFLGLATHLSIGPNHTVDDVEWVESPDAIQFTDRSAEAWGAAEIASGEDEEVAKTRVENTINFYTGIEPDSSEVSDA